MGTKGASGPWSPSPIGYIYYRDIEPLSVIYERLLGMQGLSALPVEIYSHIAVPWEY